MMHGKRASAEGRTFVSHCPDFTVQNTQSADVYNLLVPFELRAGLAKLASGSLNRCGVGWS